MYLGKRGRRSCHWTDAGRSGWHETNASFWGRESCLSPPVKRLMHGDPAMAALLQHGLIRTSVGLRSGVERLLPTSVRAEDSTAAGFQVLDLLLASRRKNVGPRRGWFNHVSAQWCETEFCTARRKYFEHEDG